MMTLLSVSIIACLPFVTLGWMSCPQSIPTVSFVSRCPSDAKEWMIAAQKKNCTAMEKYQNCSNDGSFMYHCVLNEDATMLLEVCAPIWYMSGYCARFSIANKRLVNNPGLDCTKSAPPCPARFPSNESFKYQTCYQNVTFENTKVVPLALHCEQEQATSAVVVAFLVIFGIISVCLLIFLIFGKKIKGICGHRQREKAEKSNALLNEDNKPDEEALEELTRKTADEERKEDDSEEKMKIITLSNIDKGWISLKGVKNIGNLRSKLSKQLGHKIGYLWIVDKENGGLHQDCSMIDASKKTSYTLMLGNENRANDCDVDWTDGLNSKAAKCRMSCQHFIVVETILELIRVTLPGTDFLELKCPLCSHSWEKDELVANCKMSDDEQRFLECVLNVNAKTKRALEQRY